jgi:NNP family nitrate/nitrite transporter-like MFS transporter
MQEHQDQPLAAVLPALFFVTGLFLLNFLSRTSLAPLLPAVEADLGLGHAGSGRLYLLVGGGNALGLLCNSCISSLLNHRRTVALSALAAGLALLAAAASTDMLLFRLALFGLGLATGLYLPSGIATVTALARPQDWGKALAVHEIAPNLSYTLAPLLAEAVLQAFSWRAVLVLLGLLQLAAGTLFLLRRLGPDQHGHPPSAAALRRLLTRPAFWATACAFGLAIGASFGVYTMSTLYLVTSGMARTQANEFLSLARFAALFAALIAGWLTDRLGAFFTLRGYFLGVGLALLALGLAPAWALPGLLVLQALLSVLFFPACFAALAQVFPRELRSLAVSLAVPLGMLTGLGGVPVALGACGDAGLFGLGFGLLGLALLAGLALPPVFRAAAGLDAPGKSA